MNVIQDPTPFEGAGQGTPLSPSPTSRQNLTEAIRQMLRIRQMEERVLTLSREKQVAGSVHLCIGQESVPVGVFGALDLRDRVLATYRGHGWALACGVPLESLFAEILGRATGTNGGRAGSAYLTSPAHQFIGENSIVAAGLPIANGVAMGLLSLGDGGVVVVSFGDGATNQGAAHEAMVFAFARNLPVIFVCENNGWSEMTPISAMVPGTKLFERAAGYGMHSQWVDGSDIQGVHRAATTAVERARGGGGPSFLEIQVPRMGGHYNLDIEHYRTAEDRKSHQERDPIAALRRLLQANGVLDEGQFQRMREEVEADVAAAERTALAAPSPDQGDGATHVMARTTTTQANPLPVEGKEFTYGLAANYALAAELESRPDLVLFGEDIAIPGGTFGVTRNLHKRFGERVFDTPISESAILGAAVGASIEGLRPVVEIMWSDFLLVAFDQVVNQAANVRYVSRGQVTAPLVIRMQQGITPGSCAQHSQSLEALLTHVPGIKVGLPSNAHDAYAMLRAAIADPDPVVIIESRALYQSKGVVDVSAPVEAVGGARKRRSGADLLIVTWGRMTNLVMEASDELSLRGIEATVLDLRWLAPLDEDALAAAVANTGGNVLIVHEANLTGGFGAEIAARLVEHHFEKLAGPIARIGLPDVPVPASPVLQEALMPSVAQIVAVASKSLSRSPNE